MSSGTSSPKPLLPEELTPQIDPSRFDFVTTRDLEGVLSQLGEERAMSALRLGVRLKAPGYNVFVTGMEGQGRQDHIRALILEVAGDLPVSPDIVYVHNFDDPDRPLALKLNPGEGRELRREMENLVATLRRQVPAASKKEGFEREKEQITSTYDRQIKEIFSQFQESAKGRGLSVRLTPEGHMAFIPLKEDGEPVASPEEFEALPPERREELEKNRADVQREAKEIIKRQQAISRKIREEVEETVKKFADELIDPLIKDISEKHPHRALETYLQNVRKSILENLKDFQQEEDHPSPFPFPMPAVSTEEKFLPYEINLLVDNGGEEGAPVIAQGSPTYQNLFGSIERTVDQTGKLVTNFTRIKAGDLLRASGGFLVFDLDDALTEAFVWKALKRVLKSGRLEIESQQPFSLFSVSGMVPEAITIDTRLIVTGSRYAYNILNSLDPDFREIFKVLADFAPEEERNSDTERAYAERIAHLVSEENIRHFTRDGVAEVLRFGSRRAGDRGKLSSRFQELDDLAREASFIAEDRDKELVDAESVKAALESRIFRANWVEERGRDMFDEGTFLIKVEGTETGQINALTVMSFGGHSFGRPARLTASVSLGNAGILNIEREAKLSGSTHDKGVMILAGFLRNCFGKDKPLSFTASLCFEQSYSGIDGDSASSAELYALISRIAAIPLRQDLAVTGSMNQQGEIQAIGGVNEKIEGFFRTCLRLGITGTQGVLIPASNVRHLILHPDVIEAVREKRFHIYPVKTIEEGLALMTGLPSGAPGEKDTTLGRTDDALREMAKALKQFGNNNKENSKKEGA